MKKKIYLHCPKCPSNKGHNVNKRYLLNPKAHITRKDWRHRIKEYRK